MRNTFLSIITLSLLLISCGRDELGTQMGGSVQKAWYDTGAELTKLNHRTQDTFAKANNDVLDFFDKLNEDFNDEKARFSERIFGSDEDKHGQLDVLIAEHDARISSLEAIAILHSLMIDANAISFSDLKSTLENNYCKTEMQGDDAVVVCGADRIILSSGTESVDGADGTSGEDGSDGEDGLAGQSCDLYFDDVTGPSDDGSCDGGQAWRADVFIYCGEITNSVKLFNNQKLCENPLD